ncbi:MAG: YafY family transcriptional regulator [Bacteroidales bacterium]|jgi:predicted DNA-binding transcriptional regulator YafY|nr:YafY family transcriptional regulator [Bacteroidales bacterium]
MKLKINRLFEIVHLLLTKKSTTANELAEHFEVSKRTILRDIDALASSGIPIYTTQGKGGGIAILDNFILDKTAISEEEQNQILFALQSVLPTQYTDVDSTLSKLRSLFQKEDTNWIEVDFSRWGNTVPDKERFETLKTAILKKQAIAFTYAGSYGETTDRTVYPLKLVFKSKAWYLDAYCLSRQDYRTFKINRIFSVDLLPDCFAEQKIKLSPRSAPDITPPKMIHLVLKFVPSVAYRIYDEFDKKDVMIHDDGSFTVITDFPEDSWLYGFLLSFGAAVRIIEPKRVAENLLSQMNEIKALYDEIIT